MCLDVEKGESFVKDILLSSTFKNDLAILKAAKSLIDTDTVKAVHVVKVDTLETLYGMTEQRFIELAEKLPPRGTKHNDSDE